MTADVLSDVLDRVHLAGALTFRIDVRGPWCIEVNPTCEDLAPVLPRGANHLIAFHIVLAGECWFRGAGGGWLAAGTGEAVVLPYSGRHQIGDQPREQVTPFRHVLGDRRLVDLRHERFELAAQPQTDLLCGFLGCDRSAFEPLFASLPMLFRTRLGAGAGSLADHATGMLRDDSPGADSLRLRLTELLFTQALRQYTQGLPDDARGWLAATRDPIVGRALHALHQAPGRNWTVPALARAAASSRSNLADRFRRVLGQTPIRYLTQLRMQLAADLLPDRYRSTDQIAAAVGYSSSAAFKRAFKRQYGLPPGAWRRRHLQMAQRPTGNEAQRSPH